MSVFITYSKADDYGNCRVELVETTLKNAKEYYDYKEVDAVDVRVLCKYFKIVEPADEKARTDEERYYGAS